MTRWTRPLLLVPSVLAAVLLVLLFSGEIRDNDIFWHLRTGQYIIQTHWLPVPDPFSYVSTGSLYSGEEITRRFNLTHEWLSQVIMFLIYAGTGFPGLVIARVLLLLAFCGLTGFIAFHRTRRFLISLAAALAAAGMAFYFAQSRPFLATFFFLALTMAILETRRYLWLLPPIFLIWANCHSGFILGWAMCAAYCIDVVFERRSKGRTPEGTRLLYACALSFFASALNPNGFRVLQVLWFYRASGIQTANLEWQRPIFWTPGVYSLLLFGTLLVLLFAWRKTRPVDWLLYLSFAASSLVAVRNTIFMGLIGPILMASYLPTWRFIAPAALALGSAGLLLYDVVPAAAAGNILAFRAATWQLPAGAASFISAHHLSGRMFNNYESGGYLIWRLWPLQRVFIDGRGLSEQAFADYRAILYDVSGGNKAGELLNRYGIDLAVMEGFDYLSGQIYPVAIDLAKSSSGQWALVYADATSVIFLRHPPPGIRALDSQSALFHSLEAQCEQHLQHDPSRPRCAFGLGELYASRNAPEQARLWMSRYIKHRVGPDREADEILDSLTVTELNKQATDLQAKRDFHGAEPLLRQALAIAQRRLGPDHPDTAGAMNNLATVLEAEDKYPEAEALFRHSLETCEKRFGSADPRTAMALDNLAGALEGRGDLKTAEALLRRALSIAEHTLGPINPTTLTIHEDLDALLKAQVQAR